MKAIVIGVEEIERVVPLTRLIDLPPLVKPNTGYYPESRRGVTLRWSLGEVPAERGDRGPGERFAELRTGHDKDRKQFYASVHNVTVSKWESGTVEKFALMDSVIVMREPVARYSKKADEAFTETALTALRFVYDGDTDGAHKIRGYFGENDVELRNWVEVVDIDDDAKLEGFQAAVGGWIEAAIMPEPFDAYINEDGKGLELLPNTPATELWKRGCREQELSRIPGDYLAGNVVITGGIDDDGETVGLTDEQVAQLISALALPVRTSV